MSTLSIQSLSNPSSSTTNSNTSTISLHKDCSSSSNLNSVSTYEFLITSEKEQGKSIFIAKEQIGEKTTVGEVVTLILQQALPSHILDADNIIGRLKLHMAGFGILDFFWNGVYFKSIDKIAKQNNTVFRDYPFPSNYCIPLHLNIEEEERYIFLSAPNFNKRLPLGNFDITLEQFKEMIPKEIDIPENQRYFYLLTEDSKEILLDNDNSLLEEYNIRHKSRVRLEQERICLVSSSSNEKPLFNNYPFNFKTNISTCRVQDIKNEIEKTYAYDAKYITLFLNDIQLEDDGSFLSDYNMVHRSKLDVVLNLPPLPGQLFIKLQDDNTVDQKDTMITIDVDSSSTTIKTVLDILRDTKNIQLKNDVGIALLQSGPRILCENNTLADCFLSHGSILSLFYGQSQILIKTLTGKTIPIHYTPTMTVEELKQQIQNKEGIPPNQQRLVYQGQQLEDDYTLIHYHIGTQSCITLVLRLRGGGGPFVDVSRENTMQRHEWSSDAPDWRSVSPGLTLEGKCLNPRCRAFRRMVISNHHFEVFDLCEKSEAIPKFYAKAKCPMCYKHIDAIKPGFNRCYYRIEGVKSRSENEEESVAYLKDWTKVGDHYSTYNEDEAGIVEWDYLYIFTRPYGAIGFLAASTEDNEKGEEEEEVDNDEGEDKDQPAEEVVVPYNCPICFGAMNSSIAKCSNGHLFHHKCLNQWKSSCHSNNLHKGCPICRVNLTR